MRRDDSLGDGHAPVEGDVAGEVGPDAVERARVRMRVGPRLVGIGPQVVEGTQVVEGLHPLLGLRFGVVAGVEAVGVGVKTVKKGDRILYNGYTSEFKYDGVDYLIIKEEDILATV